MTTNQNRPPYLLLLALLLTTTVAMSMSMGTLSPSDAVENARDIAVGTVQVSREKGLEVRFKPMTVLKGNMQPGSTYIINYVDDYNRVGLSRVMEKIAAYAEGKPAVMFVGDLATNGKTLIPDSFDGAIWPRERKDTPLFQTPDTLEECILFVKALLADPKLKLKHMNGQRVLPDGYTLPVAPVGAAKPADQVKSSGYFTPRTAVERASDIVVGNVQVNREKGQEVQLTLQSVLKGGMQPGSTYIVNTNMIMRLYADPWSRSPLLRKASRRSFFWAGCIRTAKHSNPRAGTAQCGHGPANGAGCSRRRTRWRGAPPSSKLCWRTPTSSSRS